MFLLSTNAKLEKRNGQQFLIAGLSLAPHGIGDYQVCPEATAGCKSACVLWFTGRTVMPMTRNAMKRRKNLFFENRELFLDQLRHDIAKHIRLANMAQVKTAVRLNVASDLDWSQFVTEFPQVSFYDYTKVKSRTLDENWPANYQLTYSLNERSRWQTTRAILERGKNVAAVFSTRYHPQSGRIDALPDSYRLNNREYQVIDGDVHDVRLQELDGSGVIVGLRFKGSLKRRAQAIKNGFCLAV